MELFYLFGYFIVEIIKYVLGAWLCFRDEVQRKWGIVVGLLGYVGIMSAQLLDLLEKYILVYLIVVVTAFIMLYARNNRSFEKTMLLFLLFTCMDSVVERLIVFVIGIYEWNTKYIYLENITGSIVLIFLVIIALWLRSKKMKLYFFERLMDKYGWSIVICSILCVLLIVNGLWGIWRYGSISSNKKGFELESSFPYVVVVTLSIFLIHMWNLVIRLKKLAETERLLKTVQGKYYQMLLQQDEDIRKSRHDWNNHLICLSELSQKEQALETFAYIQKLTSQMKNIKNRNYDVGNDIINAILNYYLNQVDKNICVRVEGRCEGKLFVEDTDICVIMANLVQNAVEHMEKEFYANKELDISFCGGNIYQEISVTNTIGEDITLGRFYKTSKQDVRNHGIGLNNVKECVERNGGKMKIDVKDGKVTIKVVLKKRT